MKIKPQALVVNIGLLMFCASTIVDRRAAVQCFADLDFDKAVIRPEM